MPKNALLFIKKLKNPQALGLSPKPYSLVVYSFIFSKVYYYQLKFYSL